MLAYSSGFQPKLSTGGVPNKVLAQTWMLWFAYSLEHGRYSGLGMDALVLEWLRRRHANTMRKLLDKALNLQNVRFIRGCSGRPNTEHGFRAGR